MKTSNAFSAAFIYPCEIFLLLTATLCGVLYQIVGIPFRYPATLYWERMSQGVALYAFALLLSIFVLRAFDIQKARSRNLQLSWKESFQTWRKRYLSLSLLASDLRLINMFAVTFVIFIQLKHLTPFLRNAVYDGLFISAERALFSGKLVGELLQNFFGPSAAPIFSQAYMFFYPFMALVTMYIVLQRNEAIRQRFALAFALTWILGIVFVYLLPTWGPCFSVPEMNSMLPQTEVSKMQAELWMHREYILRKPLAPEAVFLISGFPSIHLAIPLLCTWIFRRGHRIFFLLSVVTAGLTLVTTLYFGWHFFFDDLGSFILCGLALGLSRRCGGHICLAKSRVNSAEYEERESVPS